MNLILYSLGIFNDNVLSSVKNFLTKNKIDNEVSNKKTIDEEVDKFDIDNESSEDLVNCQNNFNENGDIINGFNKGKETSDEINIINGDMVILDKINKRKNRKKKMLFKILILLMIYI